MTPDSDSLVNVEEADDDFHQTIKECVYYAAKDGMAMALYEHLEKLGNHEAKLRLLNETFSDESGQKLIPFVVAARYGKVNVLKLFLDKFSPDLEYECTVKFDGNLVQGATALWCAAGSGQLNAVKLLVQHGADVNHGTKSDSTPLRAACFDGRLDIVKYLVAHNADINKANAYNNTCLMIAAHKGHTDVVDFLLMKGANPDEQALCEATALHYAAESGHFEICGALLDYGAHLKTNEYGLTPVMMAAERTRESVVELFCTRENLLTIEEKIDVLELMGASFANDKDNYSLTKSYHYLMSAMELRYKDPNNILRKNLCPPIPAYENWIESQTIQDLQAIRYNHNSIHMESLVVRERILGHKFPDLAHPVVFRGAVCADNGRFDRCESLWLHALYLRQINKVSVQRDLLRFAQVFSQMYHVGIILRLPNVLTVLSSCILELNRNKEKIADPGPKDDLAVIVEEYELNIITALYLVTIITKLLKQNLQVESLELSSVYKLVFTLARMKLKIRDGQTLLHLAVNGVTPIDDFHTNDVCRFPCMDTVKLLLHCGAVISEVDYERNTPLHTLTSTLHPHRASGSDTIAIIDEITKMFIEAGAHLDVVNKEGLTPAQLCTSHGIESVIRRHESKEIGLRCLASRCIAQHKISYKGIVPMHLETFIQLHCAKKL